MTATTGISVNELTLGIERLKRAGDAKNVERLRALLGSTLDAAKEQV